MSSASIGVPSSGPIGKATAVPEYSQFGQLVRLLLLAKDEEFPTAKTPFGSDSRVSLDATAAYGPCPLSEACKQFNQVRFGQIEPVAIPISAIYRCVNSFPSDVEP